MNTRKYYKFFCFISGTILTMVGCAGRGGLAPKYVEPTSGPTASFRFVASSLWTDKDDCANMFGCAGKDNVFVYSIEADGRCGHSTTPVLHEVNVLKIGVLHGIALSHDRKKMGMPLSEGLNDKDFTEIIIPAGAYGFDMASQHLRSGGTTRSGTVALQQQSCNDTMEFEPAAGRLYEASYVLNPNGCLVTVNELVKSADGTYVRQPEKTARRRPDQCKW